MHLPSFVALLCLGPAWALSVPRAAKPDNSAQVLSTLKQLSSDLVKLNNTLNSFKPNAVLGLVTAQQIQSETQQLNSDIKQATSQADASRVWTQGESTSVAEAILGLEPQIFSVLNNIVRHKPAFATAVLGVGDLSQTVEQDLITQRNLSQTFGDAITKKLDKSIRGLAPGQTANIIKHFNKAIAAYKACTGLVCLPPFPGSGGSGSGGLPSLP